MDQSVQRDLTHWASPSAALPQWARKADRLRAQIGAVTPFVANDCNLWQSNLKGLIDSAQLTPDAEMQVAIFRKAIAPLFNQNAFDHVGLEVRRRLLARLCNGIEALFGAGSALMQCLHEDNLPALAVRELGHLRQNTAKLAELLAETQPQS